MEGETNMNKFNRHMMFKELRSRLVSMEEWAQEQEWTIFHYESSRIDGMITTLYISGCVDAKVYHRLSKIRRDRVNHCLHTY